MGAGSLAEITRHSHSDCFRVPNPDSGVRRHASRIPGLLLSPNRPDESTQTRKGGVRGKVDLHQLARIDPQDRSYIEHLTESETGRHFLTQQAECGSDGL